MNFEGTDQDLNPTGRTQGTNPTGRSRDNNPSATDRSLAITGATPRDINPSAQVSFAAVTPSFAIFRITEDVITRITEEGNIRLLD
jgi:hypothetical protein